MAAGVSPPLLTTHPLTSEGGSAPSTDPGHAPLIRPAWGEGARGGTAASRAAAGGTDSRGPDGAASEGATAPEEGAADRGEVVDFVGSLAPAPGKPLRPGSQAFPPAGSDSQASSPVLPPNPRAQILRRPTGTQASGPQSLHFLRRWRWKWPFCGASWLGSEWLPGARRSSSGSCLDSRWKPSQAAGSSGNRSVRPGGTSPPVSFLVGRILLVVLLGPEPQGWVPPPSLILEPESLG